MQKSDRRSSYCSVLKIPPLLVLAVACMFEGVIEAKWRGNRTK